jgi:hypothetical protein
MASVLGRQTLHMGCVCPPIGKCSLHTDGDRLLLESLRAILITSQSVADFYSPDGTRKFVLDPNLSRGTGRYYRFSRSRYSQHQPCFSVVWCKNQEPIGGTALAALSGQPTRVIHACQSCPPERCNIFLRPSSAFLAGWLPGDIFCSWTMCPRP